MADSLTKEKLAEILTTKIQEIDFDQAKKDVEPFLKNSGQRDELNLWSQTFFSDYLVQEILVQSGGTI